MKTIVVTSVLMVCFASVYGYLRNKIGNRSLTFKALATGMPVFLAFCGVGAYEHMPGAVVAVGLVFCMLADVALEIDFIKGIALFGAGHLCFIMAWRRLCSPGLVTAVCFVLIYGFVFLLFHRDIGDLGGLKVPAFLYMALLSFMASFAFTMCFAVRTPEAVLTAAGAVCFVISDCIIAWRTVRAKEGLLYGAAILILYYGAVYLFGLTVYMGI